MSDIAKRIGVSKMTVSMALNGDPSISDETSQRVKLLAKELGYVPNRLAKGLMSGRSSNIAIIIGGSLDDYQEQFIRGVTKYAMKKGYTTSIGLANDLDDREEYLMESLNQMMIDGFISFHKGNIKAYQTLMEERIPFVLYAKYFPGLVCDYVGTDNVFGGFQMTQHLIELGHRNIGFVYPTVLETSSEILERKQGYIEALKQHNIKESHYIPINIDHQRPGDLDVNQSMVEVLSSNHRPTALFVGNDITAANVYMVANKLGLKIPDDISIGGFEGLLAGKIINPPLTTMITPVVKLGETAAEILIDKIENKRAYDDFVQVRVTPTLNIQHSTAKVN